MENTTCKSCSSSTKEKFWILLPASDLGNLVEIKGLSVVAAYLCVNSMTILIYTCWSILWPLRTLFTWPKKALFLEKYLRRNLSETCLSSHEAGTYRAATDAFFHGWTKDRACIELALPILCLVWPDLYAQKRRSPNVSPQKYFLFSLLYDIR